MSFREFQVPSIMHLHSASLGSITRACCLAAAFGLLSLASPALGQLPSASSTLLQAPNAPFVRLFALGDGAPMGVPEGSTHRLAAGEDIRVQIEIDLQEELEAVTFQWFKDGQPYGETYREEEDWGGRFDGQGFYWRWGHRIEFPRIRLLDAGRYSASATLEFAEPHAPAIYHTGDITLEVVPGPRITANPPAPLLDQPVTLTVSVAGNPNVADLRWSGPAGRPPTWTNTTLTLPSARFDDAGEYEVRLFLSTVGRYVSSAPYELRVYTQLEAPIIVVQPQPQTGTSGGRAVFTVGATGSLPLSYQWQKHQADLPGQTNFYLNLTSLSAADTASYRVRVNNASGSTLSAAASLTLVAAPAPSPTADSLVAAGRARLTQHSRADLDAAVTTFATAVNTAPQHAAANFLYAITRFFHFAHHPAANQFLDRLQFLAENRDLYDWTAEPVFAGGRLLAPPGVNAAEFPAFLLNDMLPEILAVRTHLERLPAADFVIHLSQGELPESVTIDSGDVHVLRAALLAFEYLTRTARSVNASMQLTALQAFAEDPRSTLEAILRDYPDLLTFADATQATLARQALEQAADLYLQGAGLILSRPSTPSSPRFFNLGPDARAEEEQFRQICLDLKASLQRAVVLNEDSQWRIHVGPLADQPQSPRQLAPQFVGNQPDAATTPEPIFAGTVANVGEPQMVFPLFDRMAAVGTRVELAVLVMGEAPLRYQWLKDDQPLAGAAGPKLVIPAFSAANAGHYEVIVANPQGTNRSSAELHLGLAPTLAVQPTAQSSPAGRPLALQVEASGTEPLAYQWYRNGVAVPGATQSRLVLTDTRADHAGLYTVRVSNGAGSVVSQPAAVTVDPASQAFAAPLLAEVFTESSFIFGPQRTVHDHQGNLYAYFQPMDLVGGLQNGTPFKLRESNLAPVPGFTLDPPSPSTEALAVQPDGKLVMATLRHDAYVVIRVDANGAPDPTFQPAAFSMGIRFITLQPDGRILLAVTGNTLSAPGTIPVSNPTVVRLLPNGAVDPDFVFPQLGGGNPFLLAPPVLDNDGHIYVGGSFDSVNGTPRRNFARLLPNGPLDTSYPATASIEGGVNSSQVRGIGLQSDGRAVVVGDFRIPATAPTSERIGALRFNLDGTHDTSFARVRLSEMGIVAPGVRPRALVMLPDDKPLLVANVLVRLNPDGSLDPSFARPRFDQETYWLSRAPDGRIFVPGLVSIEGESAGGLAVFDAEGHWIDSFQAGGFGLARYSTSFVPLPQSRVAVAGLFNHVGARPQVAVALLEPDGQPAFRQYNTEEPFDWLALEPPSLAAADPESFFLLYRVVDEYQVRKILVRLRADGTPDPTFQPGIDPRAIDFTQSLFGEPTGRVLLLRGAIPQTALDREFIVRLNLSGDPDPTFVGPSDAFRDTLAEVVRGPDDRIEEIAVGDLQILARDAAGRFLVARNAIDGQVQFSRLTSTGQEDPAFAPGTVDVLASPGVEFPIVYDDVTGEEAYPIATTYSDRVLTAAVVLPNGQILLAGNFSRYANFATRGLVRLQPNGSVDTAFHLAAGPQTPDNPNVASQLLSLAVDPAGAVYVAGSFSQLEGVVAPGLARLRPDGTVDGGFQSPLRLVNYGGAQARLQFHEGQLYAAGTFAAFDETFPRALWRFNPSQTAAPALDADQITFTPAGDPQLTLPALPGVRLVVLASSDLSRWDVIADLTPATTEVAVTDQAGRGARHRFYRARYYLP